MDYSQNLSESNHRWLELIQQCRTSGKSDNQWLLENNIKSPTFYYHVNQLRKKACDIPRSNHTAGNDIQEVVPLFVEEPTDVTLKPAPIKTLNATASVRLHIEGVTVEIFNNASKEVIKIQ